MTKIQITVAWTNVNVNMIHEHVQTIAYSVQTTT